MQSQPVSNKVPYIKKAVCWWCGKKTQLYIYDSEGGHEVKSKDVQKFCSDSCYQSYNEDLD